MLGTLLPANCQHNKHITPIVTGANQTDQYLHLLKGKKIAVVANQTSVIFKKNGTNTHLIDSLLAQEVSIVKVFAPEHGFRGKADAGAHIEDGIDNRTNLPVISLYGKQKKPSENHLKGIDMVVFDIQDVGVRFYTYISTLHYVMEACAEFKIPLLLLDRPNPNGHYIDGPVLEKAHKSFVGMHPVPIVYGMTIGEYGKMINGERWLENQLQCDLNIIPLVNYTHKSSYRLPIAPSPNLPNEVAVNLYPSLCLFEGTVISCGRGTDEQFQLFGDPRLPETKYPYRFTPDSNSGAAHPKHKGKLCNGLNLSSAEKLSDLNYTWLIEAYNDYPDKKGFFNPFFAKLAGTESLQKQIENGIPFNKMSASWQPGLDVFKKTRKKYLMYTD